MITSAVTTYTPVTPGTNIAATLEAFNEAFQAFSGAHTGSHKAFSAGLPSTTGLAVTAGTYPALNIAAGVFIGGNGDVYSFPAGTLTPDDPDAAEIFYVFVNADHELDVALTVPVDALIVVAKATVNGGATAFSEITHEVETTSTTLNANGDPDVVELKTGPLVIKTTTWTYDAQDRPATATEVTAVRTTTSTYSYDPDSVSRSTGYRLNDTWYFDGSHFLE